MRGPHPGWLEDGEPHRARLVAELVSAGAIRTPAVHEAFGTTPREVFVPGHALLHGVASVYRNEVLVTVVGRGAEPLSSSSQPQLMAAMLEVLYVEPGMRVLEIGTGTGYNAALLAHLVGDRGTVVSVEVDPDVGEQARQALAALGTPVEVVTGDGAAGAAHLGPFDRIIATASTSRLPRAWLDQLVDGGLLEAPVRLNGGETQAVVAFRRDDERLRSEEVVTGRFMPMRPASGDPREPAGLPVLEAVEADGTTTRLAGAAVSRLSDGIREALALSLGPRRHVDLGIEAPPWDLVMFVSTEIPAGQLVSRWPEVSVGVLTPDGGLALAEGRWGDGHEPRPLQAVAWGPRTAEEALLDVVARWRALGSPGVANLRIEVRFEGNAGELSHSWKPQAPWAR